MEPSTPALVKRKNFYFAISMAVLFLIAYKIFMAPEKHAGIVIEVATVKQANIAPTLEAVGNIETENSASIKSQVAGQIISIPVNPGQEVKQNQLLFVIDPRPFQASLDQAKANLLKDQALAKNAANELIRYEKLIKKGYISKEYYEQVKSNAASTKATVEADQAAVKNAEIQLEYTQIRAPISGRLSDIIPNPGELVAINSASTTTPLTTINQFKPINAQFSIPGQNLPIVIQANQKNPLVVTVTPDADKVYHAKGILSFIDNQINQTTGTVAMKALLPNEDERLWPGEFVHVLINLPSLSNALVVPTIAIQQDQNQQYYVYVVDKNNRAQMRHVTLGPSQNEQTSILSGVNLGEKVITKGQFEITHGSLVQVSKIG